jgi:bifunctional DNA-binding transcriptional regulator/antitoxin component of YhaV-PrlF toxin-antitoxin module
MSRNHLYNPVKAMPRISSKNQVTLPVDSLAAAGLAAGDVVRIEAEGPGTIVVRRAPSDPREAFGIFDGLYEPGYLDRLRKDWDR